MTHALLSRRPEYRWLAAEHDLVWCQRLEDIPASADYVFVPHWSEKIPREVYEQHEMVMFHPTPLPMGRGGTPIQNMIEQGVTETVISAFRCIEEMDAGPVYFTRPLSLRGPLSRILENAALVIGEMIGIILTTHPRLKAWPQVGTVTTFRRRLPAQSVLPQDFAKVYDHIRMLDADGYPRAFVTGYTPLRFEFSDATQVDPDTVTARVRITRG